MSDQIVEWAANLVADAKLARISTLRLLLLQARTVGLGDWLQHTQKCIQCGNRPQARQGVGVNLSDVDSASTKNESEADDCEGGDTVV